jgi:hypothetical protein
MQSTITRPQTRNSSVRIATRLRAARPWFDSQRGPRDFSLHVVQTGFGAHPASYPMDRVMREEREAGHLPPSCAEVKNGGAVPPLPICLHGIYIIKYRDNIFPLAIQCRHRYQRNGCRKFCYPLPTTEVYEKCLWTKIF